MGRAHQFDDGAACRREFRPRTYDVEVSDNSSQVTIPGRISPSSDGPLLLPPCTQVEFRYLSHATGNPVYAEKVNRVFDIMSTKHPANGLYPIYVSSHNGDFQVPSSSQRPQSLKRSSTPRRQGFPPLGREAGRLAWWSALTQLPFCPQNHQITFGALGDSFYEYLLKVWLQGGRKEREYRRMFDEAMDGMMKVRPTPTPSSDENPIGPGPARPTEVLPLAQHHTTALSGRLSK
jgi:hypothetical protein